MASLSAAQLTFGKDTTMLPTTQSPKQGIPAWIWLVGAAIYVVCPVDLDFVPILGWVDDVAVSYLCIKQWNKAKKAEKSASQEKNGERVGNES
jgi:uncharacterized membrane protein YkvA (DUF1232 family)